MRGFSSLFLLTALVFRSAVLANEEDTHDQRSLCHANDVFEEEEHDADPNIGYSRAKAGVLLRACKIHIHLAGTTIRDAQIMLLFAALEANEVTPRTITLSHNTLGESGLRSVARHGGRPPDLDCFLLPRV